MSDVVALARGIIMIGVSGDALDPALPRFGGYVLFPGAATSVEQVRALTDALRTQSNGTPPLIAIDQEGGAVTRLRNGVEPIPSMMALGATDDVTLARRAGEQIAFDLRRAGCTLDFAPVLDLALEQENTVIGTRAFGSDAARVGTLAGAVARGLSDGGVVPCYKHFPGHGSTWVDSHCALPVVDADERTLRERDLIPFEMVAPTAAVMMTAHLVARAFDTDRPATLSRRILFDLLRDELRFHGVLVSDCLEMNAIAAGGSVDSAVEALAAGVDMLLFSHNSELALQAVEAIAEAVGDGRVPRARLEEAYARVSALRNASPAPLPLETFSPHVGIGREIGRRAVTLVRGLPHADPVTSIAVSFGNDEKLLAREAPALDEIVTAADPRPDETRAILEAIARTGRRPLLLARRAHTNPGQAEAIERIVNEDPDSVVVSLLEPFDLPLFVNARHLLATCGDTVASIGGLADVLFGGSIPTGRVPL